MKRDVECPICGSANAMYEETEETDPAAPTSADILVASIRSCVGQIKKANAAQSPSSWGTIELAADKMLAAADTFENRNSATKDTP